MNATCRPFMLSCPTRFVGWNTSRILLWCNSFGRNRHRRADEKHGSKVFSTVQSLSTIKFKHSRQYGGMQKILGIASVYTRPELRGRGYAKAAITFVTAFISKAGKRATCNTAHDNKAMQRALESIGFQRIRT